MPKNIEDIVPREKRSIRDIPIPNGRRRTDPVTPAVSRIERPIRVDSIERTERIEHREDIVLPQRESSHARAEAISTLPRVKVPLERVRSRRAGVNKKAWAGSIIAVIVLLFAVLSLMRSSTLAYTPKSTPISFSNDAVSAQKVGDAGTLLFSVVKISDDQSQIVSATGDSVRVSNKASGTITVYNNNTASQALVATTRFQSSDGHVYRTPKAVTIPAKTSSGPGSVSIVVMADQAGADYNIGLVDFTVPGFKGDPKFTTVYARSQTSMTGGFVGMQKQISNDVRTGAKTNLENNLKTDLLNQAAAQVPADFILYPNLSVVNDTDLADSSSTADSVTLNEHGDFFGVMFKRSDLAAYIAANKLSLPAGQSIVIPNLEALQVSFSGDAPSDLLNATSVNLTISGSATATWQVDTTALKSDLAGKSKSDLASILANYPGIQSASAIIRPFWKSSFPTDPTQITIKVNPSK